MPQHIAPNNNKIGLSITQFKFTFYSFIAAQVWREPEVRAIITLYLMTFWDALQLATIVINVCEFCKFQEAAESRDSMEVSTTKCWKDKFPRYSDIVFNKFI